MSEAEMSIAALPLPLTRWRQQHGSGNLFFITVAARQRQFIFYHRRGAARQRQLQKKRKS